MKSVNYKDLLVWQRAMEAAKEIYEVVKRLPKEENHALAFQLRKCAVSIPSNIAEGQARTSEKEFNRFISIADGSRAEAETQLLLCVMLGYCKEQEIQKAMNLLNEISRMLSALSRALLKNQ